MTRPTAAAPQALPARPAPAAAEVDRYVAVTWPGMARRNLPAPPADGPEVTP